MSLVGDLHWATDSTLAAVHYLARQIANKRVLCLGTFRLEVVGNYPALTTMTAQLAREGLAQYLALERLSLESIDELVRRTIKVEGEFVNRLYAHTEGNAFFSIETLRALVRMPHPEEPLPLPGNVRALIESRLNYLSRPAREWLACAAVAGRAFDFDLIRRTRKMDEDAALEVIDELLRQGFLCEGSGLLGRDYEFVHHLVQETTYKGIHHRRRERLHRLVGEAMESLYADQPSLAGILAHHFESGSEWEKALYYHDLAAQRASEVFAWREAEEHQSRMLYLLEKVDPDCTQMNCLRRRGQILATRAELRHLQGRLDERDVDLAALSALIMVSGDEHLRLLEATCLTRYLNLDAKYERAIITAEKGLILADSQKDSKARCYLLAQIGFAHYFLGQPQPALAALESALTMATEDNRETCRHITHILGYVHFHLGNYDRSLAYQQESLVNHQALRDYNGAAWAGLDIAATYQEMGQLAEAEQYLNEHLDLARRIGARSAEAYGLNLSASWELCRGNYHAAMELFHRALAKQQELRTEHGRVAAETGIGFACYHLGNMNEAQRWLEQAVRRARLIQHRRRMAEALIGLGLVKNAAGQSHAAQGHLTEAVEVARESEARGNLAAGLSALARAERQSGKLALALIHASEVVQVARNISVITCEMWGELEIGLTLLAQGDPQAAFNHSQRALELAARCNERWIGTEQVHRAHARILRVACHDDEAANEQDRLAESIITTKADRIPDPQRKQQYLESMRCNSVI
ncbi:MAG: hypothetical protein OHK003_33000 [Anaerolineales bacterium]